MADRNTAQLDALFHADAVFVHMGATLSKSEELDVIATGKIYYKKADIENAAVKFIGDTAILLNKLRLIAVVGGNEVTNPFVVTEVYVRQSDGWKLASMSFTRLLGE
jgi:ketosteroid isomerase-like protein